MKTINYTIKAIVTFPDGVLPGRTIRVKAINATQAEIIARTRITENWGSLGLVSIEVLEIRKGR